MKKTALLALIALLYVPAVYAVPPIPGQYFKGEPRDAVHKTINEQILGLKYAAPAEFKAATTVAGTRKIAVILIQFTSAGNNTSGSYTFTTTQDSIKQHLAKATSYYLENSSNRLNLQFVIQPTTVTAANSMAFYGASPEKGDALIKEAIVASGVQQGTGAGQYDTVLVVHAGYGNESTGKDGDIWSALYNWSDTGNNFQAPPVSKGVYDPVNGFYEGIELAELESSADSLGVFCHETGHSLGLPDTYNTLTGGSVIGRWDLMDQGCWDGSPAGSTPSHLCAWDKIQLGWLDPVTVTDDKNVVITPDENTDSVVKIPIFTAPDPSKEYFLAEYRTKNAAVSVYDGSIPGSGVLLWHVDDAIIYQVEYYGFSQDTRLNLNFMNSLYLTSTYGLACVAAGTTNPSNGSGGTSNDPWPGTKLTFQSPDSNSNNGLASGVKMSNFVIGASSASFDLTSGFSLSAISPASGYNHLKSVSVTITGQGLANAGPIELAMGGNTIIASTGPASGSSVNAYFNLIGYTTGFYNLILYNSGYSKAMSSAFELKRSTSAEIMSVAVNTNTSISFGPDNWSAEITVPAGAFSAPCSLAVFKPDSLPPNLHQPQIQACGIYLEVDSSVSTQPTKPISLVFDCSNAGTIAPATRDIVVCRYDDSTGYWVILDSSWDKRKKVVSATTNHLSVFGLFSMARMDEDGVYTYPNPYKPNTGGAYGNTNLGEGIVFSGLTEKAEISIYTVTGELVRKVDVSSADGKYLWDTKNQDNKKVASGVYVYRVVNPEKNTMKKTGKIAIIK